MADLNRPDFGVVFANQGEKLAPDATKMQLGWVQEMMPYQWQNFLESRQDEAITYLLQKGVAEYSPTQEYTANKSTVLYQGNLYIATSTVTGVLPTVTASWKRISPTIGANGAVGVAGGGTGATGAAGARTNLGLGTIATANLPTTNGVLVRSANNTVISRTLTGVSGDIVVTNPDGVSGNISIGVGSNVAKTNQDSSWTSKGGITLPKGTTAERGAETVGKIRFNTETKKYEGFDGTSWNALGASSEIEVTTLSGDGVRTSFVLNTPAFSVNATDVYIGGVYQNKGTYSIDGVNIEFSEAPTQGVGNIQVVTKRAVDLGVARASQVEIQDSANIYTSTTVEGALREVGEDFAKLTSYSGNISTDPEWSDVPSRSDPAFDVQTQALANRTELLKSRTDKAKPMQDYAALRTYTGKATGVQITSQGIAGFFQRDDSDATTTDNGGTVIVDAVGRRWKRVGVGNELHVMWFGAKGINSLFDDQPAIQAAVNAGKHGNVVKLHPGQYRIKRPIVLKKGVTLEGGWAAWWSARISDLETVIKPYFRDFTGDALIQISKTDTATEGHTGSDHQGGPRLHQINLRGLREYNNNTSQPISGILVEYDVHDIALTEVNATEFSGYGFMSVGAAGQSLRRVSCTNNSLGGYIWQADPRDLGSGAVDILVDSCLANGNGGDGFYIHNPNAATFSLTRAEWNAGTGFKIRGVNRSLIFSGCNTDRNGQNGFSQFCSGVRPVIYNACLAKRDGKSGSFSGWNILGGGGATGVGATLVGCGVQTGPDDGGVGTFSPRNGLSVNEVDAVDVIGGYYYATNLPINDPGQSVSFSGGVRTFTVDAVTGKATETTSAIYRVVALPGRDCGMDLRTKGGGRRWTILADSAGETGDNYGTDLSIKRYDDAGNSLGQPLRISRRTGNITLEGLPSDRDDSASVAAPMNFLFTNSAGLLLSAPLFVSPPETSGSPGRPGQQAYDNDYLYQCIGYNTWIRFQKTTW